MFLARIFCNNIKKDAENIKENLNNVSITKKEINSGNIIEILKENKLENTNILIFFECDFENFGKCLKKILIFCEKSSKIKIIKFLKCSPEKDLKNNINYVDKNIKIIFSENDEKIVEIKSKDNPVILSLESSVLIGKIKRLKDLYKENNIYSFFSLFSGEWSLDDLNYFLTCMFNELNNNKKKKSKTPSKEELNFGRYFCKTDQINYFSKFFQKFQILLQEEGMYVYKINILSDQQYIEIKKKINSFIKSKEKNSKEFLNDIFFELLQSLFKNFNLSFQDPFHLIYVNCPNFIKNEIYHIFYCYKNNIENKNIEIFKIDKEVLIFSKVNDRRVLISNIELYKNIDIMENFLSMKETFINYIYTKYGLNFIIYKLINEKKIPEDKAIELVIQNLFQFFVSMFISR